MVSSYSKRSYEYSNTNTQQRPVCGCGIEYIVEREKDGNKILYTTPPHPHPRALTSTQRNNGGGWIPKRGDGYSNNRGCPRIIRFHEYPGIPLFR